MVEKKFVGLLDAKLHDIAESTLENWRKLDPNCGVFSGRSGVVLFLMYYYQYCRDERYKHCAYHILNDSFDALNKINKMSLFLADGVSGLYSTLFHLLENNIIKSDLFEYDDCFDKIIYKRIINELKLRNYDYFYGSSGLLFFLFQRLKSERNNETLTRYINETINELDKYIEENKYYLSYHNQNNGTINFGTPHGITSWILVMSKIEEEFPKKFEAITLMEKIISPMFCCLEKRYGYSYFPDTMDIIISTGIKIADFNSRLAWCYGDLLCGIALGRYGYITENEEIKQKSKTIISDCAKRFNLKQNHIRDAGICHGTAGLVTVFNNINRKMSFLNQPDVSETITYWMRHTLNFSKYKHGYAGYCNATFVGNRYKPEPRLDFLSGISGIGLSMIGFINKDLSSWDELLLLS